MSTVGIAHVSPDALLHRVADGCFVLADASGRVSRWGIGAHAMFGRRPGDVLGRSLFAAMGAGDLEPAAEAWRRFLEEPMAEAGEPGLVRVEARHASGRPLSVELLFVPMRPQDVGFDVLQGAMLVTHPVRDAFEEPTGTLIGLWACGPVPEPDGEPFAAMVEPPRDADEAEMHLDALRAEVRDTRSALRGLTTAWQQLLADRGPQDGDPYLRCLGTRPPRIEDPPREALAGFDDQPQPMALLSLHGRFERLNPTFKALVGYSETEFAQAVWPSAHDRGDYREQQDQLRRMAMGEVESVRIRSTYMHEQGLMIAVRGELSLVRDADGRPGHLLLRAEERAAF